MTPRSRKDGMTVIGSAQISLSDLSDLPEPKLPVHLTVTFKLGDTVAGSYNVQSEPLTCKGVIELTTAFSEAIAAVVENNEPKIVLFEEIEGDE
jgi:hypothetical protein